MKKIRHYEDDCFEFHKSVVERKESDELKRHIRAIDDDIKEQYEEYDDAFSADILPTLEALDLDKTTKDELKSLYSYDAYMFRKLKRILTVDSNNRQDVLCPNCTINNINSFDHYLPQTEFAEFVDNPINLIPSCTECNGHKSKVWRKNGERLFLNLYIDELLFFNPFIIFAFFLTFSLLSGFASSTLKDYHYDKLKLCRRFGENRERVFSGLANEIYTLKDVLSDDAIKDVIKKSVENDRKRYGYNYWVAILKEAVCDTQEIFDFFKKKPY